jgi:glycolate oxidase iron-sulfur subunit
MQTSLTREFLETPDGQVADEVLRNCVHCGFCNATCPTYQLTGDELDGPRGRIYLIKQMLEGNTPAEVTQQHLDRCLSCRACETTCPSGVEYHLLLDTGRELIEQRVPRPALRRLHIPSRQKRRPPGRMQPHPRQMLLLDGCVQPALAPAINDATRRVLDALGIRTVMAGNSGCCGAVSFHLGATSEAKDFMRRNIDAWWPCIEAGAEAIVVTASGCAPMVKDYGRALAGDPDYAGKAARVSELARDISEIIAAEPLENCLAHTADGQAIAFHSPCTLQHGQRITGVVERLLEQAGYALQPVADGHLCCGSAGTYSILQPDLSEKLRNNKLAALQAGDATAIATANIGCLMHMSGHARVPVRHWIELLDTLLPEAS